MYNLPKEYISVSQINLWQSDSLAYMKKYFMNIPDEPSPMMNFGKQFAKDIEDYSKGEKRDFNFPTNFIDQTLLYRLVEYKIEHEFEGYKFLGFADNVSDDFQTLVDFKTGMAKWSQKRLQDSLQMLAYSAIIYLQKNVIPVCVIDYYGTILKGSLVEFSGVHERFAHQFEYNDLVQCSEFMDKKVQEISNAYDVYQNDVISKVMANYADILHKEKLLATEKEEAKLEVEMYLKNSKYLKQFGDKVIRYTTVNKKSFTFSQELVKNEVLLDLQKKQEIEYGIAKESVKSYSMITLTNVK